MLDLVLLIDLGLPGRSVVAEAVRATFERRKTHDIPVILPDPPPAWRERYAAIAAECGVSKTLMEDAIRYVSDYWESLNIRN